MKKILTTLTISGAILSAGLALATTASADELPKSKTSTAEFAVEAGTLSLDKVSDLHFAKADGTNPTIADFSKEQTLKLDKTPVSSTLGQDGTPDLQAVVSDYRGSHDGWDLSVSVDKFVNAKNANDTIADSTLSLSATADTTEGQPVTTLPTDVAVTANGAVTKFISASEDTGTFENAFDLAGELTIPANKTIQAGTYQSTVTWTLSSTPKAAAAN